MTALPSDLEWCLNCADWVDELHPITGWCYKCTTGKNVPQEVSVYVQLERYLQRNADHLEHYMVQGHSVYRAVRLVSQEVRPTCLSCGALIIRGPRNSVFCTKNEHCRRVRSRYQYLHKQKGLPRPNALSLVIQEYNLS